MIDDHATNNIIALMEFDEKRVDAQVRHTLAKLFKTYPEAKHAIRVFTRGIVYHFLDKAEKELACKPDMESHAGYLEEYFTGKDSRNGKWEGLLDKLVAVEPEAEAALDTIVDSIITVRENERKP